MARPKAQDRIEITDPGELLDLAKSAARKRMDATGEDREQVEATIKEAYDKAWGGGEYLRARFVAAGHDLLISDSEYRLATRGSGLYDSTISSALKRFAKPGEKISRRVVNGFYHITIAEDLSKEAVAKSHEDSIRKEERERIIEIIRALTGEDLDVRIEPITARVLIQAIKLNVKSGDVEQ